MAAMPPLRLERLNRIRETLERQPAIRASDLAAQLGVSRETVRRDLATLERSGLLVRSHGGAMRPEAALTERPQELREKLQAREKDLIARLALELVADGAAIALDSSSTALALARLLRGRPITVITNGLHAAQALAGDENTRVLVAGGLLHHGNMSFVGPDAEAAAERRFPDVAFLSAPAVAERGVMDTNAFEVAVKQALVRGAERVCVLADSTKFERTAFEMVLDWTDVDVLISDQAPRGAWTALLGAAGVELRTPEGVGSEAGGEDPQRDSSQRRGTWQ